MSVQPVGILWPYTPDELAAPGESAGLNYTVRVDSDGTEEDLYFGSGVLLGPLTSGRFYWVSGDDQESGSTLGGQGDLLLMLERTLNSNTGGVTWSITRTASGKVRFTTTGGNGTIRWSHANTTLRAEVFGWTQDDDSSAGADITSPNVAGGQWLPGKGPRRLNRRKISFASISATPSGTWRGAEFADALDLLELEFGLLDAAVSQEADAADTAPLNTFGKLWAQLRRGRPVRVVTDASADVDTYELVRLHAEAQEDPLERDDRNRLKYKVGALALVGVTA